MNRSSPIAAVLLSVIITVSCSRIEEGGDLHGAAAVTARAESLDTAVLLIQRGDETVFSYGNVRHTYMCHSIRKPLLGSLYGIYVDRGVIQRDATLAELGIDDLPPSLTPEEKRATVRDLLMSRSGVYHPAAGEVQSMRDARPERGSHEPGTFYYYNNWDFNVLGTIFMQETGEDIYEAFDREIAQPIGMEDYSPRDGTYSREAVSRHAAYFFRMSSRDLARFGRLYANRGVWDGVSVVPAAWIEESTTVYPVENPGGDPYGYLWKIIPPEAGLGRGFYHTGLGVHLLMVLPDHDVVIVHRVDTDRPFSITWREIRELLELAAEEIGFLDGS